MTEHRTLCCVCLSCGVKTRGRMPEAVQTSHFGPRLVALGTMLTSRFRLSRRQLRELLSDLLDVPPPSLGSTQAFREEVGAALLTPYQQIRDTVRASTLAWVDLGRLESAGPLPLDLGSGDRRSHALSDRAQSKHPTSAPLRGDSGDRRARALGRDLLRLSPTLWTFLSTEGVEPTNNRAEQALRPAVIRRKLCFGSQSGAGLRATERLLSITHTCRQHQRNLLRFLTESVAAHRQGRASPSLLPAN